MTRPQKVWQATLVTIKHMEEGFSRDAQPCGYRPLQIIVQNRWFERLTTTIVTANVVAFCIDHRDIPAEVSEKLMHANYFFIAFYGVEQTIKITAFSHAYFFPYKKAKKGQRHSRGFSAVNFVDFVISAASLADVFSTQNVGINVLRSFRVLRLVNMLPSVRALLKTARKSILTIIGCFGFLIVFIFAFGVVGVPVVGNVKRGKAVTRHSNFDTTLNSLITLFQMVAGEDWLEIMRETSVRPPFCTLDNPRTERLDDGDCGSIYAPLYFVTFMSLCYYFFLPLFVASFITTFFETVGQETSLNASDASLFEDVWEAFDPHHSGKLSSWKLRVLFDHLEEAHCNLAFDASRHPERYAKLERTVAALIKLDAGRGQAVTRSLSFTNVLTALVILQGYDPYLPAHGDHGTQEVIVHWVRSRNAVHIRDYLIKARAARSVANATVVAGRLHVWVLRAQNLSNAMGFNVANPYCVVTLGCGDEGEALPPLAILRA